MFLGVNNMTGYKNDFGSNMAGYKNAISWNVIKAFWDKLHKYYYYRY